MTSSKNCLAKGCGKPLAGVRLFCGEHWREIPYDIQVLVFDSYGLGDTAEPHPDFITAVNMAIDSLKKELAVA